MALLFPLQFKEGVQLTITKAIQKIMEAGIIVYSRFQVPCIVTAGRDGQHGKQSKHYTDEALDLRIFHVELEHHEALVKGLKELLGKDFDIVLEHDHIHVEFDPK